MNKFRAILIVGMALMAALAFARPEPNAFLNKAANTHSALMSQVKSDPEVMSRFMRHFGMTREQVISYFSGLRSSSLAQDGVYLVYNCQESNGEIQARVIFYKKGTKVWVDSTGTPVLKMSCANPMVRGSDDMETSLTVSPKPAGGVRPLTGESTPVPTPTTPPLLKPTPTGSPALLTAESITPPVPPVTSRGGFGLGWLPLLGLAFVGSSGSNGSTGTDGKTTGTTGDVPPVPEPASMIVLGAGVAFVAARRRKKQS